MPTIVIDCEGVKTAAELWQRYLDATQPDGAAVFGRNLDAFWDALAGGPGWPGDCELVFRNTSALRDLRTSGGASFLDALRKIAADTEVTKVTLD